MLLAGPLDAAGVDEAPAGFLADDDFFVDDVDDVDDLDDAEAEADADAPDTVDDGRVAKLEWAGVVRNSRTPTRPAIVPPSTIGVRFTGVCPSGGPGGFPWT